MPTETFNAGPNLGPLSDVTIIHGDCIEAMAEMPADSVDAIVTDPPYGLGFMGKEWDELPPGLDWAKQCLRVLKPGGHLLAFGGTRTWHRLAVAVEDAGFEIRDSIAWLYGSGFPKSLDVSKAIDKMDATDARRSRALRFTEWMRSTGITSRQIDEATGTNMGGHYLTANSQPQVATLAHLDTLRPLLPSVPQWVEEMAEERTVESENFKARAVVGIRKGAQADTTGRFGGWGNDEDGDGRSIVKDTNAHTPEAEQWQGWGTALKPGMEICVMGRKPFRGTVAQNVLQYGTGAINIDATRITSGPTATMGAWEQGERLCASCAELAAQSAKPGTPETKASTATSPAAPTLSERGASSLVDTFKTDTGCSSGTKAANTNSSSSTAPSGSSTTGPSPTDSSSTTSTTTHSTTGSRTCNSCHAPITRDTTTSGSPSGRWPSNVVLDADQAAALDEQSGTLTSGKTKPTHTTAGVNGRASAYGADAAGGFTTMETYGDSGGASRFFLNVEPDPDQLEDLDVDARFKYCAKAPKKERPVVIDADGKTHSHSTVKPLALMRWLVRLVTPPGGVVLDPFAGSGTTVEAALLEDFRVIGIERESDYLPMIQQRIARCLSS